MNQTASNHTPHSPIRQASKGAAPNKVPRSLADLMQEALPYIEQREYHPVLFPTLLRSLTRYIHVHSLASTGGDPINKGSDSVSHPKESPMMKRLGRRLSMQGSTRTAFTSDVGAAPVASPRKLVNESTGSSAPKAAPVGKMPRQRRHSMLGTVPPPSGSGHPPKKKPQSEFDGYPLPPNKMRPSNPKEPVVDPNDPRPVVTASPMRRRTRRHSIAVPLAPPSYHQPSPVSPRTPRQQQNPRLCSPRQQQQQQQQVALMPPAPMLALTEFGSANHLGTGPVAAAGTEGQYENSMEIRVVRRKLEQARQNLAESQESFERLKQSQTPEALEEQLMSFDSNSGGGAGNDVHLDMAILDKDMRREAQQIAKLEDELERLIKQQQSQ
mmetsp:Transcript_11834/g.24044  ORF Transcript_11834/g.24044 Transcript_11834/m.24044 type:complete len:383 (+) Transcript_11834:94-1242(+)